MVRKARYGEGKPKTKIVLYGLSTCVWCRKTKDLLNNLGIKYEFLDVDLLRNENKEKAINELKKYNPLFTFPTLVINDDTYIVGYKEDEIREALGFAK